MRKLLLVSSFGALMQSHVTLHAESVKVNRRGRSPRNLTDPSDPERVEPHRKETYVANPHQSTRPVFSTKNRERLITREVEPDLF